MTPTGAATEFPILIQGTSVPGITVGPDGNIWYTQSSGATGNEIVRVVPPTSPPPPSMFVSTIGTAAAGRETIPPNTWITIRGANLAPPGDARTWRPSDFTGSGLMPTTLDGVNVFVNGTPAIVYYISPNQIDVLTPPVAVSGSSDALPIGHRNSGDQQRRDLRCSSRPSRLNYTFSMADHMHSRNTATERWWDPVRSSRSDDACNSRGTNHRSRERVRRRVRSIRLSIEGTDRHSFHLLRW